jgi:hypothetical protein
MRSSQLREPIDKIFTLEQIADAQRYCPLSLKRKV